MSGRPSQAKMCSFLSAELRDIRVRPVNPADIKRQMELAVEAEPRLAALAHIASEMGWHADADLDFAWELIQEYEARYHGKVVVPDVER